jgi:hypothetical protein
LRDILLAIYANPIINKKQVIANQQKRW